MEKGLVKMTNQSMDAEMERIGRQERDEESAATPAAEDLMILHQEVLRASLGRFILQVNEEGNLPTAEVAKEAEKRFQIWLDQYKPHRWTRLQSENYCARMEAEQPGVNTIVTPETLAKVMIGLGAKAIRRANPEWRKPRVSILQEVVQQALNAPEEAMNRSVEASMQLRGQRSGEGSNTQETAISLLPTGRISGSAGREVPTFANLPSENIKHWL